MLMAMLTCGNDWAAVGIEYVHFYSLTVDLLPMVADTVITVNTGVKKVKRHMIEVKESTKRDFDLAKKYNRDDKAANSHNYTNGIMVAQVAAEVIKRAKDKGLEINRENLYKELLAMNGGNAFNPGSTVGPVTYSETDRAGVDQLQLYTVKNGVFSAVGSPFKSEFINK